MITSSGYCGTLRALCGRKHQDFNSLSMMTECTGTLGIWSRTLSQFNFHEWRLHPQCGLEVEVEVEVVHWSAGVWGCGSRCENCGPWMRVRKLRCIRWKWRRVLLPRWFHGYSWALSVACRSDCGFLICLILLPNHTEETCYSRIILKAEEGPRNWFQKYGRSAVSIGLFGIVLFTSVKLRPPSSPSRDCFSP